MQNWHYAGPHPQTGKRWRGQPQRHIDLRGGRPTHSPGHRAIHLHWHRRRPYYWHFLPGCHQNVQRGSRNARDNPDEANHRLLDFRFDECSRSFLCIAADFADKDYRVRFAILVEHFDGIQEGSANNRVASDANAGGLPDAQASELVDRLVGQCAAAADHANVSLFVDAARHNANFAFARRNDARTIRSDEARLFCVHRERHSNHVKNRNAFGDANDQGNFRFSSLKNGVRRKRWRNKNDGSVRACSLSCVRDSIEYRPLEMLGAALSWSHATHYVGSVLDHLLRVKSAFATGETLHNQFGLFIYQNAHRATSARATTFCAPSFMPSAIVKLRPDSRRIF